MAQLKSRRYLIAAILGTAAFLSAFGIAMATFFQAAKQVPADAIFSPVLVQNEKLGVFPTAEATGSQVNIIHFRGPLLQPPLRPGATATVFIKNLSTARRLLSLSPAGRFWLPSVAPAAR